MRLLIVLTLCCLLPVRLLGQDFEAGMAAQKRGDYVTGLRNLLPLAEQGQAEAQHQIGIAYEYGRGVRQSDVEALKWYTKAADRGVAEARYKLGVMYDNGWGVATNDAEAVKWYAKAAAQGHAYAQFDLGLMLASGSGIARDTVRAHMWLSLAIAQGNNHMIKHRNEIAKNMTPAEIAQARQMALEWANSRQQ